MADDAAAAGGGGHAAPAGPAPPSSSNSSSQQCLLPSEQQTLSELLEGDGLCIMAAGLGWHRLVAAMLQLHDAPDSGELMRRLRACGPWHNGRGGHLSARRGARTHTRLHAVAGVQRRSCNCGGGGGHAGAPPGRRARPPPPRGRRPPAHESVHTRATLSCAHTQGSC
jgi:hypothetical protein